jgi:hypothetical protein
LHRKTLTGQALAVVILAAHSRTPRRTSRGVSQIAARADDTRRART